MAMLIGEKDRINTVMPQLVVYRLTRAELAASIVEISAGSQTEAAATLRFKMNGGPTDYWTAFKEWWKKNPNTILLGCKLWNVGGGNAQNKGYYWCPAYRCPNPSRTDNHTNFLEFIIQRNDANIFNSTDQTIYEFYFINLTH